MRISHLAFIGKCGLNCKKKQHVFIFILLLWFDNDVQVFKSTKPLHIQLILKVKKKQAFFHILYVYTQYILPAWSNSSLKYEIWNALSEIYAHRHITLKGLYKIYALQFPRFPHPLFSLLLFPNFFPCSLCHSSPFLFLVSFIRRTVLIFLSCFLQKEETMTHWDNTQTLLHASTHITH